MMTALSAEDQRQRGESLGADRYLVKSQVGIEDVVNAIHEVLGDRTTPATIAVTESAEPAQPTPEQTSPQSAPTAPVSTSTPQANYAEQPANPAQ